MKRDQHWSPDFFLNQAKKLGSNTEAYIGKLLNQNTYPEIVYKQCLGIIHLRSQYTTERVDKACKIALDQPRYGYHIIKNILANKTDMESLDISPEPHITKHMNIRGAESYN